MRSRGLNSGLSYCPIHTPLYTEQERWGQNDGLTESVTYCSRHTPFYNTRDHGGNGNDGLSYRTAQYTRRSTTDEIMGAK